MSLLDMETVKADLATILALEYFLNNCVEYLSEDTSNINYEIIHNYKVKFLSEHFNL